MEVIVYSIYGILLMQFIRWKMYKFRASAKFQYFGALKNPVNLSIFRPKTLAVRNRRF